MSIFKDIEWLKEQVKACLVNHKGIPPWELDIKPDKVERKGKELTKHWTKFDEEWFWWETLP